MTPNKITFHCSATAPYMACNAKLIDEWHRARGWSEIGYHWVIELDGTISKGRDMNKQGAHVAEHNANNIGICYVGGLDENGKPADTMTPEQYESAVILLKGLQAEFNIPDSEIYGHRDFPGVKKECPCFDVKEKFKLIGTCSWQSQ